MPSKFPLQKKIEELFCSIFKNCSRDFPVQPRDAISSGLLLFRSGSRLISEKGIKAISELQTCAFDYSAVKGKFTEDALREVIYDIVADEQVNLNAKEATKKFQKAIRSGFHNFELILPVQGIALEEALDVGGVRLSPVTSDVFNELSKLYGMSFEIVEKSKLRITSQRGEKYDTPVGETIAITRVFCSESSVVDKGISIATEALNALSLLLFRFANYRPALVATLQGGSMIPPYAVPSRLVGRGGNWIIRQRGFGPPQDFHLTKEHRQYIEQIGLGKLSALLSKRESDLPQYHRRVRRAVNWFGLSLRNLESEQQFLATVFSLESVLNLPLCDNKVSVRSQFTDRVAFLLGNSCEDRKRLKQRANKIYDKRNALAHGGKDWVSSYWVDEGRDLAWNTLVKLIFLLDSVAEDKDFRNYISKKKDHCDK